ncbi:MAG TPA: ATP-binding protein [Jatrophihabitans sp.]|nr:ATP-binding protein [Jatrophihabitans sp.]
MSVVLAVSSFLLGAAAAAFLAAWFVRHSGRTAVPPGAAPTGPAPATSGLSQRVLGALDLGVVVMDRDEIAVYANPVARTMQVVDADRLSVPALAELVRRVTDSGEPDSVSIDLPSAGRGPEYLTFAVRAMPLREQGRVSAVVLRFFDITDAHRLELVRRDFVANVSHELKTPVGALTLLAEAVQEAADDPEAVQHFAARMQREGSRLGRLVQELIELSRLQGAEPLPGADLVQVERLICEAVDRSRLRAEQSGITVLDKAEPDLYVRGNETQLGTAIGNLVDNAIAYSAPRTRVGLTSRTETDPDGRRWVAIAVSDQGIGIAESDLDRVFERFYRVDPARSRATGGTGLGLAIVKHIATNHGGSVKVWSVVGSGSTFTIRLPLAEVAVEPAVESAVEPIRQDGARTSSNGHFINDLKGNP